MTHAGKRVVMVLAAAGILFTGCGATEITSMWRDRTITIDGSDTGPEWENARHYFKDEKVTLGVMNDADFLYVRVSSRDRAVQRNLMMLGMTIWVNPKGNRSKYIGIRYPGPRMERRSGEGPRESEGMPGRGEDEKPSGVAAQEEMQRMLLRALAEIEMIGPGNTEVNSLYIRDADSLGVVVRINVEAGNMVYELCLPLKPFGRSPYYLADVAIGKIGLGFETGKRTMGRDDGASASPGRRGGGMGGRGGGMGGMGGMGGGGDIGGMGGMGGMGGRRGQGGGRGGGGMMQPEMEPINLWMNIIIATNAKT